MGIYYFEKDIAGTKTLWVALFAKPEKVADRQAFPPQTYEFLIPSPIGSGWIPWIFKPKETLESLHRLQDQCSKLRESCDQQLTKDDSLEKAQSAAESVTELNELIDEFRRIIDEMTPPEKDEDNK